MERDTTPGAEGRGGQSQRNDHADHTHRDVNGGWLRPTVFGAMDGLVSNLGLVTGVAGSSASTRAIVISGLAGLVAGAFSMAAGEYTSVASQRELVQAELEVERRELRRHPEDELRELAGVYESRGVEPRLALEVARQLHKDPQQALETHAREELGVNPSDLPSPMVAAVSSFMSFSVGAAVPVLPYLLGATSLWYAVLLALVGLFTCGAIVARITARKWWFTGLRQLTLGAAAAAVTYGLGVASAWLWGESWPADWTRWRHPRHDLLVTSLFQAVPRRAEARRPASNEARTGAACSAAVQGPPAPPPQALGTAPPCIAMWPPSPHFEMRHPFFRVWSTM